MSIENLDYATHKQNQDSATRLERSRNLDAIRGAEIIRAADAESVALSGRLASSDQDKLESQARAEIDEELKNRA